MSSTIRETRKLKLDPKVIALQTALEDRDPFCSGICAIPDFQRFLYYRHTGQLRLIDFSNAGSGDLDALYRACRPAEFGRNGESVLDESYRKAGKMDLISFSTLFDPRSLGIHEQVSKALLTESYAPMDMELYKLNVYGKGDFFKAHKDTPRGQDMFGSLVVVFPTAHEGGQFVLRQAEKKWTLDFADKIATTTEPSVCFMAFYGDLEHEVLPVTSGYRVTLTYNLYHKPIHPGASFIHTPFHLKLKQAFVDLINDPSKLPDGGYLGFGLMHQYVYTREDLLAPVMAQLKGSDRALADVCDALELRYSLRLLYRDVGRPQLNLLTTEAIDVDGTYAESWRGYLKQALEELEAVTVEGIMLVERGDDWDFHLIEEDEDENEDMDEEDEDMDEEDEDMDEEGEDKEDEDEDGLEEGEEFLKPFFKKPATKVLEITPMRSSVDAMSPVMTYGNEPELEHFYGTACMVVELGPAAARQVRKG